MAWTFSYPQIWFTYGPKTKDDSVIKAMLMAGATGVRFTFSFGTPELQIERVQQLRRIAKSLGSNICIIADLQGEKCRLAEIAGVDGLPIQEGSHILLTSGTAHPQKNIPEFPIQFPEHLEKFELGDVVMEGDGALTFTVIERTSYGVHCIANTNGVLHPGRGMIVQKQSFQPKAMTAKDHADMRAIVKAKMFDAVAVSFVAEPNDISVARVAMKSYGDILPIVAKIETQRGIENIDSIIDQADCVLAARGDLALTTPWIDLPAQVDAIARSAAMARKPWILATQLMEGLERFTLPTRAEICDLAHWMQAGAFGAMLSSETAFGSRPVEAVRAVAALAHRYQQT